MSWTKMLLGDSRFASPASTGAAQSPWPISISSKKISDAGSEDSYQALPESPLVGSYVPKAKPAACLGDCRLLAVAAALAAGFVAGRSHLGSSFFTSKGLQIWDPDLRVEFGTEPLAKSVIRKFDAYNMARGGRDDGPTFDANVDHYLAPDLLYESVGFGTWRTPAGWARGEESNYGMTFPETVFTQMLFFGDRQVSTTTTYGTALWSGDFMNIKAPKQWVTLRITDFYHIREEAPGLGRVSYNFMMIDWADVFRQVGRPVLPPSELPEGLVLPPAANDGVPAPLSVLLQAEGRDAEAARTTALAALQQDWAGQEKEAAQSWHKDMTFYGPGGIGVAQGMSTFQQHVLQPFHAAFTNRSVETQLVGCEGNYCGVFAHIRGTGTGSWLGLPTAGKQVALRAALHYRVVDGKVKEGWAIFDMPGLFEQLGLDLYAAAAAGGRSST